MIPFRRVMIGLPSPGAWTAATAVNPPWLAPFASPVPE